MKYYLDTEFHEYTKKPLFGKPVNTIELISIGMVAEDGREYYAICRDFDLKAAWENEWLRENVLKGIHHDLSLLISGYEKYHIGTGRMDFAKNSLKSLLDDFGKTRAEIAEEVFGFCTNDTLSIAKARHYEVKHQDIQLYGYYADYDWVVFCWLFGRMIDLPKGFPMYCRDLKQIIDEKAKGVLALNMMGVEKMDSAIDYIKSLPSYPKQGNEHNALEDAIWNKKLHEFLSSL